MSLEPSKTFRFERTVTLGHVLTAISLVATLGISASLVDRRFTVIEIKQTYFEKGMELLTIQNHSLAESQAGATKSLERITTILEERSKRP